MTNNNIPSIPVADETQQGGKNKQKKPNHRRKQKEQQQEKQNEENIPKSPPRKRNRKHKKKKDEDKPSSGDPFGLVFDPVPPTRSPNTEEPSQQEDLNHGPVENSDDSDISPITPIKVPTKKMHSAHLLSDKKPAKKVIDDSVFDVEEESDKSDEDNVKANKKVIDWNLSKSTPTPPTPISPQRLPFQSISTASLLIQTLEESLGTDNKTRVMVWREWALMMKECEMLDPKDVHKYLDENYQQLNFKEVFVRSKILERVVESVIMDPDMPSVSELWELFGHCLIGDENTHYQLIHYMTKLGDLLKGKKYGFKEYFIKLVVNIASEMKIKPEQQKYLMNSLHTLDKQILETLDQISKQNLKKDAKHALESKVDLSESLVKLCQEKRKIMQSHHQKTTSMSTNSPAAVTDLDSMFHEFTTSQSISVQLKKLEDEKSASENNLKNKMNEAKKNLSALGTKEKKLLERKKQLEDELAQVNQDLANITTERTKFQQQQRDVKVQLEEVKETYKHRQEELNHVAEIQKEEKSSLNELKKVVSQTRSILLNTLGNRMTGVEAQLHQCTVQYIEKMGVFLEYMNQRMLELLTKKISPLCEKLNSLGRKREQSNSAAQMQLIDASIIKYHKMYLKAISDAENLLQKAEEIHLASKSNFEEKYNFAIQKQIYGQLELLAKSQSVMLQFNERISWVSKEVSLLPRTQSKNDLNYDTDASEISEVFLQPDDAPLEELQSQSLRNSNSSVSSAEVIANAKKVKRKQSNPEVQVVPPPEKTSNKQEGRPRKKKR